MSNYDLQRNLENNLGSEEFIKLYTQIRERYENFKSFSTPMELIAFLHDYKQKRYQENDSILRILIEEYQTSGKSQLIYNYFLKIFTPGLKSIFYRFRERVKEDMAFDDFDLWSQIRLLLLDILNTYDTKVKPNKIAVTIMSRIRRRLTFWHSKLKRERQTRLAYGMNLIQEGSQLMLSDTEYRESLELVKERLNNLVQKKVILENDAFIILATRIYGKSLKELAREQGLHYGSLKSRRRRIEKKIKKFLLP